LDHPDCIARLAVLDIIPTGEVFERADMRLALSYWPWSLLAQPEPLPERMIMASADAVVDNALTGWGSDRKSFPVAVRSASVVALRDPATVHAICEEYRAAATLDFAEEMNDRKMNRRITCSTLALWGKGGPLDHWYTDAGGLLGIWRDWANDVTGHPIEGGHFFPEHNPRETAGGIRALFGASARTNGGFPFFFPQVGPLARGGRNSKCPHLSRQ